MAIDKFADRLLQHFDSILFCRARIMFDDEDEFDKKTVLFNSFKHNLNKITNLMNTNNLFSLGSEHPLNLVKQVVISL